ncbi:hypothetical protein NC653_035218 [Populus alba x Populus x berolinensis]|uniref:Uncharacterized protein n=1 Tax=Populus alba x Populus x berolinensis TaxID=444605 RepID=A0AAD6LPI5_9ROSI|nr:hypothetical protein NC653_035218 [Populus alba x Populus x berolinensis]
MAFTSSIFSHIPLNNQRIYSPISINQNYSEPPSPPPQSPPTSTEKPWPSSGAGRWLHWLPPYHSKTPNGGGAPRRRRWAAETRRW